VRIFKNIWFSHFARKEGIANTELKDIVNLLEAGQADADLEGPNQGSPGCQNI
jgi:hypothetical protein